MQRASNGKNTTELMEYVDEKLTYGGARRISKYESALLDQQDESFDHLVQLEENLHSEETKSTNLQTQLKNIEDLIVEYCTNTTGKKILIKGYHHQFPNDEERAILDAPSDREMLEGTESEPPKAPKRKREWTHNAISCLTCHFRWNYK